MSTDGLYDYSSSSEVQVYSIQVKWSTEERGWDLATIVQASNEQNPLVFFPNLDPTAHCCDTYASCYSCTSVPEGGNLPLTEGGREKPTDACEPVSWVLESGDVGEITRMSFTLNIYVKVRISREVEKAKRKTPLSTILKVTNMNTPLHIIVELKLSCAGTCHNTHSSVPFSFRPFSN